MRYENDEMRSLAGWLVAHETCEGNVPAHCVCEKLRKPLSTLAGKAGYRALISRALTLAKVEVPSLAAVKVGEDGSIAWDEDGEFGQISENVDEGGIEVVTQLLRLLVLFIGKALTLRFIKDVWPGAFVTMKSEREKEL